MPEKQPGMRDIQNLEKRSKELERKKRGEDILPFQRMIREKLDKRKPEQRKEQERDEKINNWVAGRIKLISKMMETSIRSGQPASLENFWRTNKDNKEIEKIIKSSYAPDDKGEETGREKLYKELATDAKTGHSYSDFYTVRNHEELIEKVPNAPKDMRIGYWKRSIKSPNTWFAVGKTQIPGLYCVAPITAHPGRDFVTYNINNLDMPSDEREDYFYIPPTSKEK